MPAAGPRSSSGGVPAPEAEGGQSSSPPGRGSTALEQGEAAGRGRLGPYALLEVVATRPFTVTYRARHEELGRIVLVRTLRPSVCAASVFAEAIAREARALGALEHEGIIALYDFARTESATWMVLEDPGGVFLSDLLARTGRLEVETAAAIALGIARALGHVHERGIVHDGLRPSGVLLTPKGGVKLFEIAAPAGQDALAPPEPIRAGEALGPPHYTAPERILGEAPAPASDVFALGVVLYEMLAGRRPFEAHGNDAAPRTASTRNDAGRQTASPRNEATPKAALQRHDAGRPAASPRRDVGRPAGSKRSDSAHPTASHAGESKEVAHRIRSVSPAPLRAFAPRASGPLERVVMRCLAKHPDDRFESAGAVARALEDAMAERAGSTADLVRRALVEARFVDDASGDGRPAPTPAEPCGPRRLVARAVGGLLAIAALVVAGGAFIERSLRDPSGVSAGGPGGGALGSDPAARGFLRVLARPWADVLVDGEHVDTTPVGRPIPVRPGRHFVTFRHPNAPDEKRTITVAPGQTVVLDVIMRIDRGEPDAGALRPPIP